MAIYERIRSIIRRAPFMKTFRFPALKILQGEKTIYTFKANGKHIFDFASISRIKRNEEGILEGYQRIAITKHVEEISNYLESDNAILTNSIVVCFNDQVTFEPLENNASFGYLNIPYSDEKNGLIVDGQQRVTALSKIEKEHFEVVVNAFITNDALEQYEQFLLVNNTKPLSKSLIYELIPGINGEVPKSLSDKRVPMQLIQELNSRPDSPFYHKIKTHTYPDGIIKDNTLIKAINHSINDGVFFNYSVNIITGNTKPDIEGMLSILYAYWGAVAYIFKQDWNLPPTKTRLTHGAGIISLSHVMEELIHIIGKKDIYLSQDFMPYLEKLSEKCNWSRGQWDFGNGIVRDALDIQNITKDISHLKDYLLNQFKSKVS